MGQIAARRKAGTEGEAPSKTAIEEELNMKIKMA
jgi:hypothetical protein